MKWLPEVEGKKEEMLHDLQELLAIPSILDESSKEPGAPFGRYIRDALLYMLSLGKRDGFVTKNVDGYAGHIEYGQGEEIIGVLVHLDVVPATEGWTSPPFAPEIRDGKLYARGAIDDKGPTMAAYYALKILKEAKVPLSKRVRLIMGTDEESHWRCMDYYLQKEAMPTMAFTPDAYFPIISAEKGFMDIQIRSEEPVQPIAGEGWTLHQFQSGIRVNMVPDRATAVLHGEKDVFELKEQFQSYLLERNLRGYAKESDESVTLVLLGKAYHGSEPEKGINAGLELARFLTKLDLDSQGAQFIQTLDQLFIDGLFGEKLGIAQEDEVVGKLTVNLGVMQYKVGQQPYLRVNIRYPVKTSEEQILQHINKRFKNFRFQIAETDVKPGHYFPPSHPLVATLARVYEEQTGEKAELLAIAGASYARALDTCVAYGAVFPGKEEMAHQTDEYIEIADLLKATAIYTEAIYQLAK